MRKKAQNFVENVLGSYVYLGYNLVLIIDWAMLTCAPRAHANNLFIERTKL